MRELSIELTAALHFELAGCGYNTFQTTNDQIEAGRAEFIYSYQRRSDWMQNLGNTVNGAAKFEQNTPTKD